MKPIEFQGQHKILSKPKKWDEKKHGTCAGLPIGYYHDCLYSCWKFNLWEKIQILFGKHLTLIISGNNMPPVSMEIDNLGAKIKEDNE